MAVIPKLVVQPPSKTFHSSIFSSMFYATKMFMLLKLCCQNDDFFGLNKAVKNFRLKNYVMSRRSKGTSRTLQYHGRLYSNSWPLRPHMAITCFEKKFSLINFYLVFVSRFTSQIHFLCELRIQKYNARKILGMFLLYCTCWLAPVIFGLLCPGSGTSGDGCSCRDP